jgi:hypothetical protein
MEKLAEERKRNARQLASMSYEPAEWSTPGADDAAWDDTADVSGGESQLGSSARPGTAA